MGEPHEGETVLRVGSASPPERLAAAISHGIYDDKKIVLRAIGAGAVNQAAKGIAIATGYVAPRGHRLSAIVAFDTVKMPDKENVTAIIFKIIDEEW